MNRFGFFGQFLDNKGVDVILDALILLAQQRRIPTQGIVLELNGANEHYASSAYLEKVKGKIAEVAKLAAGPIMIRHPGQYARDQLADRMRAVDWVIVPSTWWEVFGLVASEAWMFGRPVIASDIGGLGERVRDNVDGFKFPARDVPALASLLVRLTGSEREWMRVNGQISAHWRLDEMFAAHMDLWREGRPVTPTGGIIHKTITMIT